MSQDTAIQYADSTLNLQMGCSGCELWNRQSRKCYAGAQTQRYAGKKGWPADFSEPVIFPERIKNVSAWKDLAGIERKGKPWIPASMPRIIFLNDMGDTFTKGLPDDWLAEYLPALATAPHVFLVLTKRPSKFAQFSRRHKLPSNIWPGTTVTSQRVMEPRLAELVKIDGGGPRWVSIEPMWEAIDFGAYSTSFQWAVFGGESDQMNGERPVALDLDWLAEGIDACRATGSAPFIKQLGSVPFFTAGGRRTDLRLSDSHGGKWEEWPENLRVREYPIIASSILL